MHFTCENSFPFGLLTHDIWQDDAPQDSKGLLKEDELLEEELMVLSSVNPRQMLSLQVASGEINHLHEKVAALEGQLKDEQQQHQEVIEKIEDAQHKIHL
jgi:chromosome segregation ATPase